MLDTILPAALIRALGVLAPGMKGEESMANQALNIVRMILLVLIVLLLGLTVYLYFKTGKFNFGSVVSALGCLVFFLITGRKQVSGKQ